MSKFAPSDKYLYSDSIPIILLAVPGRPWASAKLVYGGSTGETRRSREATDLDIYTFALEICYII